MDNPTPATAAEPAATAPNGLRSPSPHTPPTQTVGHPNNTGVSHPASHLPEISDAADNRRAFGTEHRTGLDVGVSGARHRQSVAAAGGDLGTSTTYRPPTLPPFYHDIEVRLLSHTDDPSTVIPFPNQSLDITASQLKQLVFAMANGRTGSSSDYFLFMGRRVHDDSLLRDVVTHLANQESPFVFQLVSGNRFESARPNTRAADGRLPTSLNREPLPRPHNMNYEQRMNHLLNHRFGSMAPAQVEGSQQFSFAQQPGGSAARSSSTTTPVRPAGQQRVHRQPSTESVLSNQRTGSPSIFGDHNRPQSTPPASNAWEGVPRGRGGTSASPSQLPGNSHPYDPEATNPRGHPEATNPRGHPEATGYTTTNGESWTVIIDIPLGNPIQQQAPTGPQPSAMFAPAFTGAVRDPPNPSLPGHRVIVESLQGARAYHSLGVVENFLHEEVRPTHEFVQYLAARFAIPDTHLIVDEFLEDVSALHTSVQYVEERARHVNQAIQSINVSPAGLPEADVGQYAVIVADAISRFNDIVQRCNHLIQTHPHYYSPAIRLPPLVSGRQLPGQRYVVLDNSGRPHALMIGPMMQPTTPLAHNLHTPLRNGIATEDDLRHELGNEIHTATLRHLGGRSALDPQNPAASSSSGTSHMVGARGVARRGNAARADLVQPAAAVGGLAPREPAEMRDLLAPIVRNLWLALRIGGLLYFFNLGGGMHWNWRPLIILGLGAGWYVVQAGLFNEQLDGLRGYLHRVVGVEAPAAANGNGAAAPAEPAAPRAPAGYDEQTWLARRVRGAERSIALFLASLWPGVGEAAIHLRMEQVAAERRRVEQEEQEEREAAEAAEAAARDAAEPEEAAEAAARDAAEPAAAAVVD